MNHDIAIIGAGPAGMAFACMLQGSGLDVVVVEKLTTEVLEDPPVDGRDIAMTHLSLEILQGLGIWQRFDPASISPIREARVVDGDSSYCLNFDTTRDKDGALGYLLANHLIRKAVYEQTVSHEHITLLTGQEVKSVSTNERNGVLTLSDGQTITASLVIAADTRFSETRRKMGISADMLDFGRTAIVCEMEHELAHNNVAFECFHYGRTLAILPMPGNVSSIVITVPSQMADAIMQMSEEQFNEDVMQRFGGQLGAMKLITERYPYPLVAVHARRFYGQRFALIGDAAVGMHPVTAHGYNLGLSGADILANEIKKAVKKGYNFASESVLSQYQHKHRQTTLPLFHGTNQVVGLFTNDSFPATLVRKAVLRLSNNLPPVKWAIKRKLMSKRHLPPLPLLPGMEKLPFFGR
jgi:ubiquinone biosynthesis UbiH/UbiF/VisC/COQ6 family hydroxylase